MEQGCPDQTAPAWHTPGLSLEALLGVFKHSFDLLARDTRKPAQEIIDAGPVFQILKERLHRDTSSDQPFV